MPRNKKYLETSQFGSIPPKVIILFCFIFVAFVIGSTIIYMLAEKWNFLDALYFAIVTISTVGYGDIVPTTSGGKFMNIIFTLVSFCGIFLLFRVVVGYVVDHQIAAIIDRVKIKKAQESRSRRFLNSAVKSTRFDSLAAAAKHELDDEEKDDLHHGKNLRWVIHLFTYLVWLMVWTLFYTWHPSEDMSFFNALYFGVVTSTTIGYGRYTPNKDAGKIFCVALTFMGTLSLAILAGSISRGIMALLRGIFQKKTEEKGDENGYLHALEECLEIPKSGQGKVDRFDFVCQMLVGEGKVTKQQISKLIQEFDKLDVNNDGVLDVKDFGVETQHTLLGDDANAIQMANVSHHQVQSSDDSNGLV